MLPADPSGRVVYGRSLVDIAGSNPARCMDACVLWVLCCQVEVSAKGRSFIQSSPADCGLSWVLSKNLIEEA
jgi:hypothetical protein